MQWEPQGRHTTLSAINNYTAACCDGTTVTAAHARHKPQKAAAQAYGASLRRRRTCVGQASEGSSTCKFLSVRRRQHMRMAQASAGGSTCKFHKRQKTAHRSCTSRPGCPHRGCPPAAHLFASTASWQVRAPINIGRLAQRHRHVQPKFRLSPSAWSTRVFAPAAAPPSQPSPTRLARLMCR